MKKNILQLLFLLICLCLTLTSCSFESLINGTDGTEQGGEGEEGNGENTENTEKKENLIYNSKSELYLIMTEQAQQYSDIVSPLLVALDKYKDVNSLTKYASVDSEPHEHEIVVGNSDRAISKAAIRKLEWLEKNRNTDVRYLIYSDGASVAIVYDEDVDSVALTSAIESFVKMCSGEELVLRPGTVEENVVDVYEFFEEKDKLRDEKLWSSMESAVGGGVIGKEFVTAMKQFYSLYTNDQVLWLANLYEPSICVCNGLYGENECKGTKYCGTGAFYYSNSARDTIGYLPDVESTNQALGLLNSTGITRTAGYSWKNMLDDEMLSDILAFVRAIQREDGYFVHPQWPSPGNSRISRDLNWATNILNTLGAKPYYTTPTGLKGIGAPTESAMKGHLCDSSATLCSSVILVDSAYLPQLESIETFKNYLNALNVRNNSYSAGNTLASMASQISARDKQLGLTRPNSLYQTMIDHLNENQNPENGTWDYKKPGDAGYDLYYQVNGLMKVTCLYGSSYPIQYIDQAVETAISAITYDKAISAAVDIYNPWFALTNIFNNLNGCGGTEGKLKVTEIRKSLYESAPETLIATRDKISICKKPDGSFSYSPKYSSQTSQGCPAAVPNSVEGDVNGTVLSCSGLIDYVYSALGLSSTSIKVPIFGDVERVMFMNEIGGLRHTDKPNSNATIEKEDFESYDTDEVPVNDSRFASKLYSEGVVKVVDRADGGGKALLFDSKSASTGDYVNIKNQSPNPSAKTFIFEGDFLVEYSAKAYAAQVFLGSAYMFSIRVVGGEVRIYENSSATESNSVSRDLGVGIPLSQWFRVRVEYYHGTYEDVRIKFFIDTDLTDSEGETLLAATDNYYDKYGNKLSSPKGTPSSTFGETQIFIPSDAATVLQLDNVASYKTTDKYVATTVPSGSIKYNIEEKNEEKTYDFENGIDRDLTVSDNLSVVRAGTNRVLKAASLVQNGTLEVPVNLVDGGGKCTLLSFDILAFSATAGDTVLTAVLTEEFGSAIGFALVAAEEGGETFLAVAEYNGSLGSVIPGAKIPLNRNTELKIEYYNDYRTAIIYVDGEFMGASNLLYSGGKRRTPTEALVTFNAKSYEITLDNLTLERNASKYTEAVEPDVDSVVHDFENGLGEVETDKGSSLAAYSGSSVVKMDSTAGSTEIRVPMLKRSKISSAIVASVQMMYNTTGKDGVAHDVCVKDEDGNVIFGVTVVINGEDAELYEMKRSGEPELLLATFKANKFTTIGFEVYPESGAAYVLVNGAYITLTGNFAYPENIMNTAAYLAVTSSNSGSVVFVDNVQAETLFALYEKKTVSSLPGVEAGNKITFEKSNDSSLPQSLYKYLGGGASVKVKTVLNTVMGEYSNAAILRTNAGYNDKIGINAQEDLTNSNCVVFETDFKVDSFTSNSHKFWFYLSKNVEDASDIIYQVSFSVTGGKLYFFDRSATKNYIEKKYYTDVTIDEWHRLKIEYYAGDKDTARIRLFLDGELIYVSNNYFGRTGTDTCPASKVGVKKAYFYTFADTGCDLYVDNMALYGSDATCTDTPTK